MNTNNPIWGAISTADKKITDLDDLASTISTLSEKQREELFIRVGFAPPVSEPEKIHRSVLTASLGFSALPLDKETMAEVLKTLADILSRPPNHS